MGDKKEMTQEKVMRRMKIDQCMRGRCLYGVRSLWKPVGEEEAMRPNKTDIDVALAAVPRRVTQGQVSDEKLN